MTSLHLKESLGRSPLRLSFLIALISLALSTTTNRAFAQVNVSDENSLRSAILNAAPGQTINVAAGTITLTSGELAIAKDLTITGQGAGVTTISGNNNSRVFFINPGAPGATTPPTTSPTVRIVNLTIANGKALGGAGSDGIGGGGGAAGQGGGLLINGGVVTIDSVMFTGNSATGGSGGFGLCNSGGFGGGGGGIGGPGVLYVGGPGGNFGGNGSGGPALASAELYDPASGTWAATGNLDTARWLSTATLLANGKVLVAGGADNFYNTLGSARLYDPVSGTWTATGSLNTARYLPTATLLPNGKVLVAGGGYNNGSGFLASAELYDPASGTWVATDNLSTVRVYHTATLLSNGKVLVVGGYDNFYNSLGSAELYDPASGTWTATGNLATARASHTATLLSNGKVLIAGGADSFNNAFASAELYDPASGTWTATGSLNTGRIGATATLLPSGKVLVAEGGNQFGGFVSAELYDPASGTWTATGSLNTARGPDTATLLPSGKVLASGGYTGGSYGDYLASAELYDPVSGTWAATGSLNTARAYHTAALLPNGRVLVAGGYNPHPVSVEPGGEGAGGGGNVTYYGVGGNGGFGAGGGGGFIGSSGGIGGFGGGGGGSYGPAGALGGSYGGNGGPSSSGSCGGGGGGAGLGGAIFLRSGTLNLSNSAFVANSATGGYGGSSPGQGGTNGQGIGGAIFIMDGFAANVSGLTFMNNVASDGDNDVHGTLISYSAQVEQPINSDGTSVFNVRRGVVPVKFTLTQGGVATCDLPPATIALTRTAGGTTGQIDESVYSGSADTGSNFRIDSCQYIYNLSASALGAGTYRVDILIDDQIVGSATFQLK